MGGMEMVRRQMRCGGANPALLISPPSDHYVSCFLVRVCGSARAGHGRYVATASARRAGSASPCSSRRGPDAPR
eukprot:2288503-Pyramimonas_sp.AAC.1